MKEIVKFKNGKYGVRKRNLFERFFNYGGLFKDFKPQLRHWRHPDDTYFKDCQVDTYEEVQEYLLRTKNDFVDKVL